MVAYAPGQQGWQGRCNDLDVWIQNLVLLLSAPSGLVSACQTGSSVAS